MQLLLHSHGHTLLFARRGRHLMQRVVCSAHGSSSSSSIGSSSSSSFNFSRSSSRSTARSPRQRSDGRQQHWQGEARQPSRRPSPQHQQQQQQQVPDPWQQFEHRYLVTSHPGLEQVTAADLQQRCQELDIPAGIAVLAPGRVALGSDTLAAGYAAAVCLSSATRVLQLVAEQQLDPTQPAGQTVYDATREAADWAQLLLPEQTLGVHCAHFWNNSNVTNSQLVQRRVRDAVCDAVRDTRGVRPAPPQGAPDLPLVFQMLSDKLQLFRDVGGGSLHRRGYRTGTAVHKAALNEAAAAGLLLLAGWKHACQEPGMVLADPMCGSGTLLIEAALMATHTAPGLLRDTAANPWPVHAWPDFQQQLWSDVMQAAQQRAQEGLAAWRGSGGRLLGNDCHAGALQLARASAKAAGVSQLVRFHEGLCGHWQLPSDQRPQLVVANPPWGLRLLPGGGGGGWQQQATWQQGAADDEGAGGDGDLEDTWQQLAYFLKQQCGGADAWLLSGNPQAFHHLGMSSRRKRSLSIGGHKATWAKYEVWAPSPPGGAGAGAGSGVQ